MSRRGRIGCLVSVLAFVAILLWLLYGFSEGVAIYGQDNEEQRAVKSCLREVRDGHVAETDKCGRYAVDNLRFYEDRFADMDKAADRLCFVSLEHLGYALKAYSGSDTLILETRLDAESDCRHHAVNLDAVEAALRVHSTLGRDGLDLIRSTGDGPGQ